jgi:hypothetical protein
VTRSMSPAMNALAMRKHYPSVFKTTPHPHMPTDTLDGLAPQDNQMSVFPQLQHLSFQITQSGSC